MTLPFNIIRAKQRIPDVSHTIDRSRLYDLLAEAPGKRLTTVIAGPGFGKTTLLAQYCHRNPLPVVWYQLDEFDRDLNTVIQFIVNGLRSHFNDFGESILQRLSDPTSKPPDRNTILTLLLNALEDLAGNEVILVLDDFHCLRDDPEIIAALQFLLNHVPPWVHIMIGSRRDTGLKLSRLRALGVLLEISEKDLAFSPRETAMLFRDLYQLPLSDDFAGRLQRKTDGWISGMILFRYRIAGLTPARIEAALAELRGTHSYIKAYMEENVFDLLNEETRRFLLKTSILTVLDAKITDRLLNIANSKEILHFLSTNHLFTFAVGDSEEIYSYHQLWRDFLGAKLINNHGKQELERLHHDAGRACEAGGDLEEALRHYLEAGILEEAGRVLSTLGRKLFYTGRHYLAARYFKCITDAHLNREPWLLYIKSLLMDSTGDFQSARAGYRKAQKLFLDNNILEGANNCMLELARIHYINGDFPAAIHNYNELVHQNPEAPALKAEVFGYLIFIYAYQGRLDLADQLYRERNDLLLSFDDHAFRVKAAALLDLNQGFRYLFTGEFHQASSIAEQSFKTLTTDRHLKLVAFYHHLMASLYHRLGEYHKGMNHSAQGIRLLKDHGYRESLLSFLLLGAARNALGAGQVEKAEEYTRECYSLFKKLGSRLGQASACIELFQINLFLNKPTLAEENLTQGLNHISGLNLMLLEGELWMGLARIRLLAEDPLPVPDILDKAAEKINHSKWHCCRNHLLWAWQYYQLGRMEESLNRLGEALDIASAKDYDALIVEERSWIIPLLAEAYAKPQYQRAAGRLIHEISPEMGREINDLAQSAKGIARKTSPIVVRDFPPQPPLQARLFGPFSLVRGETELSGQKWKSNKVRLLCIFLLAMRPKGYVKKEVLMELLWPDEDFQKSSNRFHVTMSHLRRTLEPEMKRGAVSSYIKSKGDSYWLNVGDNGRVDAECFSQEINAARLTDDPDRAMAHQLKAVEIHKAPFLEEEGFDPWCGGQRELYFMDFLSALKGLIRYWQIKGDYSQCIVYSEKYLQNDPYEEGIYQRLMHYHSLTGNRANIKRVFERCRAAIESDLKCPLSENTHRLYQQFLSDRQPLSTPKIFKIAK